MEPWQGRHRFGVTLAHIQGTLFGAMQTELEAGVGQARESHKNVGVSKQDPSLEAASSVK